MDTLHFESMTAQQRYDARAAIHDAAKARAVRLREQAIDDLWSRIGRGIRAAWRAAGDALGPARRERASRPRAVAPGFGPSSV
jgi:hypothetical protein